MELADNFVQFSVTLLGFCLSGMRYLKGQKAGVFSADLLFMAVLRSAPCTGRCICFCSQKRRRFLCIGVWLGGKRYFSFYFAILPSPLRRKEALCAEGRGLPS